MNNLKSLPLCELKIVAIAVVYEVDSATDFPVKNVEMDVLDEELWNTFSAKNSQYRCGCCGQALKYACAITHVPTNTGYWIGRDCANKVANLRHFSYGMERHTVAILERIACNKREADFIAAHPEAAEILQWAKTGSAPRIARDMIEKLRRYGNLSEKQIAVLIKIRDQDVQRRAAATGTVQAGRQVVRGIVRKASKSDNEFNPHKYDLKLLVDLGNGVRLWGNAPEYVDAPATPGKNTPSYIEPGMNVPSYEVIEVGDTVEFKATVSTGKDPLFGFWKRPAGFKVLRPVAPTPAV